ncbi:Formate dehydrogenase 1 [Candida tropicalis]
MTKPLILMVLYPGDKHSTDEPRLLGTVENELGIRKFVEEHGYELITTANKTPAPTSTFDKYLPEAEIIITTPFYPAYLTEERLATAKKLKLCITAGVGSDNYDLEALNQKGIAVLEVTGSNVQSVAEHAVMTMLILLRNYGEGHHQAISGGWDIAAVAKDEFDMEGKVFATVGAGRIGYRILERLIAFNPKKLLYYDYQALPDAAVKKINDASKLFNDVDNILERVDTLEELFSQADVVTLNCPLYEESKGMVNKELISKMKKGSYLINTARGALTDPQAVADAVNSGHIAYGGDVWPFQPAPKDMPWRTMHNPYGKDYGNAMTIHVSGTSLDAQARYAKDVKDILGEYFNKTYNYPCKDIICLNGEFVTKSYGQHNK